MKKRVLIHSLVFCPDGVSSAYLYGDIADSLKRAGLDVVVLTTTPHYNRVESQIRKQPMRWKVRGLLKKSEYNGIPVYHVPQKKFRSTVLRLLGFVYWHVVSFCTALCFKDIDVILSPSPPLTIGLLNIWLGKLKGAKVVYNVQEIYPDILGRDSGAVHSVLSRMERYIYSKSSAVTTIDRVFYDRIVGRFVCPDKLRIIPNFVDTCIYRPFEGEPHLDRRLFIANDNLKLMYAGNIGLAQDWDTLIEVAKRTRDKAVDYYVIGDGVMRGYLEERIGQYNLDNIHLLPYQPRESMPGIIGFSDIQFIFMDPKMAAYGFPSKVYTIMASAKPMLVCSPADTPIVDFLRDTGCAKIVTWYDACRKADEICEWMETIDAGQLRAMGARGLCEIESKYSKDVVTKQYVELINNL